MKTARMKTALTLCSRTTNNSARKMPSHHYKMKRIRFVTQKPFGPSRISSKAHPQQAESRQCNFDSWDRISISNSQTGKIVVSARKGRGFEGNLRLITSVFDKISKVTALSAKVVLLLLLHKTDKRLLLLLPLLRGFQYTKDFCPGRSHYPRHNNSLPPNHIKLFFLITGFKHECGGRTYAPQPPNPIGIIAEDKKQWGDGINEKRKHCVELFIRMLALPVSVCTSSVTRRNL